MNDVVPMPTNDGTVRYIRVPQFMAQWFDDKPVDAFNVLNIMELAVDMGREMDIYIVNLAKSAPAPKATYKTGVYKEESDRTLTLVNHKFEGWDGANG